MIENNSDNIRLRVATLLGDVVNNRITVDEALKQIPAEQDELIGIACHALQHFKDDEDIHKKDNKYKELQIREMQSIIHALKNNVPLEKSLYEWLKAR